MADTGTTRRRRWGSRSKKPKADMPKLPQGVAEPSFLLGAAMIFGFGAPLPRLVLPGREVAASRADQEALASDVAAVGRDFATVIAEHPEPPKSE